MDDSMGSRYIVNRNLTGILDIVLVEVSDFTQSTALKLKSLGVLLNTIRFSGSNMSVYVEKIFQALYKNVDNEEKEVGNKIEEISQEIGMYTQKTVIIPIMLKHISDLELKNAYQALNNRLRIFACILVNIHNIEVEDASTILSTLDSLDIFNLPESPYTFSILFNCYKIYHWLVVNLKHQCKALQFRLFMPLLLMKSVPDTVKIHEEVHKSLEILAINCDLKTIDLLISVELEKILSQFNTSHKNWRKNSPDRFAFDAFVRNAGQSLVDNWIPVLSIINECCEAVKDLELRMDMIALVQYLVENLELREQIIAFSEYIVKEILLPAVAWKPNKPNYKIRKGAISCIIKMFENDLVEEVLCYSLFGDFISVLKSTLDDDWDFELRYLSVKLFAWIFKTCWKLLEEQNLLDTYQLLLKRMDDSQNTIRMENTKVLLLYFKVVNERIRISESIYEFIVKTLFIHFDDQNDKIRECVRDVLRQAIVRYPKKFLEIANENLKRFTHKLDCDQIIKEAENYLNNNK
jgi:hypothetical protein